MIGFQAYKFIKEARTQVFSYEFWEIFKNTFFTEHLLTTASGNSLDKLKGLRALEEIFNSRVRL